MMLRLTEINLDFKKAVIRFINVKAAYEIAREERYGKRHNRRGSGE
jgi:hypothetical protein